MLAVGLALIGGSGLRHRSHRRWPQPVRRRVASGPAGIIIHHSDTPGMVEGQYVGAALIDRSHRRRGFAVRYHGKVYHIGYHYVIREDGVIEAGRPECCPGAHAKRHNDYLGICLVGDFSSAHNPHCWAPSRPTEPQLRSLVWLCVRLMVKYHIRPERVIRHCDVGDTECPGDRFPYAWLQRQLGVTDQRLAKTGKVIVQHGDTEIRNL
jgi:N-acetylmuramoyl-L-alanine amidase-like protein